MPHASPTINELDRPRHVEQAVRPAHREPPPCDWFVGGMRSEQLPITIGAQRLCGIDGRPAVPNDRH